VKAKKRGFRLLYRAQLLAACPALLDLMAVKSAEYSEVNATPEISHTEADRKVNNGGEDEGS